MLRAPQLPLVALALAGCAGLGGPLRVDDEPPPPPMDAPVIPEAASSADHERPRPAVRGPSQLVAGGFHACVRREDRRVACWGLGDSGQLGDGTTQDRASPVEVVGLVDVEQVALGLEHSCARLGSGQVRCWGANPFGQLGDGTDDEHPTPVPVARVDDAIDLQLGDFEACVLTEHGDVACWGGNQGGMPIAFQPDSAWRATPRVELRGVAGRRLAVTQTYRCLYGGGDPQCWGDAAFDPCAAPGGRDDPSCPIAELLDVVDLDLDSAFGCAVIEDGAVRCWGSNSYGQTPTGGAACYLDYPEAGCPRPLEGVEAAVQVAVGTWHACALDRDGAVTCWGANNFGQLGTPLARTQEQRWADVHGPTRIERWHGVVELAVGRGFTCARTRDGAVACLGDLAEGRRPRPLLAPRPIAPARG